MATSMTTEFLTKYDPSGVDSAVKGQQQLGTAMKETANQSTSTSTNFEGLFRRLERPLSFIAFSGLANDLTDMGGKGMSATMMIEKGFHAAGEAIMYFNPIAGMAIIAGTALFEAIEKVGKATKLTKDEIEKLISENDKSAESYRKAADEAQKMGLQSDIVKNLNDQANALDRVTSHTKDRAKAELDLARQTLTNIQTDHAMTFASEQMQRLWDESPEKLERIKKAQADYSNTLSTYTAVLVDDASKEKDYSSVLKKQNEMKAQAAIDNQDMAKAKAALAVQEKELKRIKDDIITTTDPKALQNLEDQYNKTMTLMNLEQKHVSELKTAEQQREALMTKEASALQKFGTDIVAKSDSFMKDLVQGNKKNLDKDLANWIESYAQKLFAAATADAFIDPLKAAGEFAGFIALEALAGSIGGGSSSSSAASSGALSSPSPSGASGAAAGNQSSLVVNINGAQVIDPSTMSMIVNGINDLVQKNGYPLVATQINGVSPMPGT